MACAAEQAHEVGDDESEEADPASGSDGGSDAEGGSKDDLAFERFGIDAHVEGIGFTEAHEVERAREAELEEQPNPPKAGRDRDQAPRTTAKAAKHPKGQAAKLLLIGQKGHEADARACEAIHRNACQEEGGDQKPSVALGDLPCSPRYNPSARKGGKRDPPESKPALPKEDDPACGSQTRARMNPQETGISKGIAKKTLQRNARDGEDASHQTSQKDTRKADRPQDLEAFAAIPEDGGDMPRLDRVSADPSGTTDRQDEEEYQPTQEPDLPSCHGANHVPLAR